MPIYAMAQSHYLNPLGTCLRIARQENIIRVRRPILEQMCWRRRHTTISRSQRPAYVPCNTQLSHLRPSTHNPLHSRPSTRTFTTTACVQHNDLIPPKPGQERHITIVTKEGQSCTFAVADGDNILDIAQSNDLEMEGACGGSCACSTCHVIVESEEMYDKMEEPSDDENDMLDLAFGLTETSRLGCQVKMSKELDGLVVSVALLCNDMTMTRAC